MILKTENLSREFVRGDRRFYAVNQVNVKINENEISSFQILIDQR